MDGAIPGAYPATPLGELEPTVSAPPAPAPHQRRQDHDHDSHQHKLHKPGDPRGHGYTDSGVGLVNSEPIHSIDDHEKPRGVSEASSLPSVSDSEPKRSTSPHEPNYTYAGRGAGNDEPAKPAEKTEINENANATRKSSDDSSPPYWGNLPKSLRGGIYNTVTGHGSPGDDHEQHHHMPQRSAPERAHVGGDTKQYPVGAVYNTVAGHGSQDRESQRHTASHPNDLHRSTPGGDAILAPPLPGITEEREREKSSEFATTETRRADIARGFLPETAVRDDVALLASLGGSQRQTSGPSSATAEVKPNEAIGGNTSSRSPRAFALTTSQRETRQSSPESDSRGRDAALATAAAAGAGIAASEQKDKSNKLKKPKESSPAVRSRARSKGAEDKTDKFVGGVAPHHHKEEEVKRSERRSSDEGFNGEKKQHKILGIFHRRKDSKGEREPKDREAVAETKKDVTDHHGHKKETAAAAAVGASTYGLMHHHKDDKQSKDRSTSEPFITQPDTRNHPRHMSVNEMVAATAAESVVLNRKSEETAPGARHQARQDPSTDGFATAPPARSTKRRSLTPPASAAGESETSTRISSGAHSHSDAAKYAGAGAAAGLGASVFAKNFDRSSKSTEGGAHSSLTSPKAGVAPSTFESPRQPPPTPAIVKKSTRAPSPKSISPQTTGVVNERGNYNALSSGTASGVKTSSTGSNSSGRGAPSISPSEASGEAGEYNVLPSGTPSGVKLRSKSSRSNMTANHGHDTVAKDGDGQYNTLATGTPSGVDVHQRNAREQGNEGQAARHGLIAAPIPFHGKDSAKPVEEQKPSLTAFPPPEVAEEMSPEVLPDSYKAQSHPTPNVDNMDRSESHRAPSPPRSREVDSSHYSTVDPALAGATGAWASKAGPSSGILEQGKITHTCEHCGRESDISSEFTKENMEKMNKKHGSTGNWWQSAWTSI